MKKDVKALILWASVGLVGALMCASCDNEAIEPIVEPEVAAHDTLMCGVLQLQDIREAMASDSVSYIIADDTLRMERKSVAQVIGAKQCKEDVEWDLWYCSDCHEYYLADQRKAQVKFVKLEMMNALQVK